MNRAFSLVELSIVLVILGLLTGGILAGQSLIRASELRAVSTEYQRYITAIGSFRDKYFALPGDMTNATSFWGLLAGTSAANDATCNGSFSSDTKTCNGDGNGQILSFEAYHFWQHLADAGLIEGQYTGKGDATYGVVRVTNAPASKLDSSAVWFGNYGGVKSGDAAVFDGNWGNDIYNFDKPGTSFYGGMTPTEAWNIDKKIDDGKPGAGKAVAPWSATYSAAHVACTTAASSADIAADYLLSDTNKNCGLFFIQLW